MKNIVILMASSAMLMLGACEGNPVMGVETVAVIDKAAISELMASHEALKTQLEYMQEAQAKSEIVQLAHAYAAARDSFDGQAYANVFAPNGKFHFGGEIFEGREAIAARVPPKSEATGPMMHFVTTSHIEMTSPTTATGQHYGIAYLGEFSADGTVGPVPGKLASRGIYHDSYVLTDEGWKIAERAYQSVLK